MLVGQYVHLPEIPRQRVLSQKINTKINQNSNYFNQINQRLNPGIKHKTKYLKAKFKEIKSKIYEMGRFYVSKPQLFEMKIIGFHCKNESFPNISSSQKPIYTQHSINARTHARTHHRLIIFVTQKKINMSYTNQNTQYFYMYSIARQLNLFLPSPTTKSQKSKSPKQFAAITKQQQQQFSNNNVNNNKFSMRLLFCYIIMRYTFQTQQYINSHI
eukprot:TRINITY_DN6174_c0_g1_i2.p1 TRINITY_DN6174_c0_g1~~TRINITY_DN6174_c0_g1_i2.p1  ORF type:complete len:215 (-),score=-12.24 TRINITY_DN6174_c0_g1_i2:2851-3495(-)